MAQTLFATQASIDALYPRELAVLAANEQTRLVDTARVEAALERASSEMRTVLAGRYTSADLAQLDDDGLAVMRGYCVDIALYYVSISFSRTSDTIKARYDNAIKRLDYIGSGKGGLTFMAPDGSSGALAPPTQSGAGPIAAVPGSVHPNEAIVLAPERRFSRDRNGGWP